MAYGSSSWPDIAWLTRLPLLREFGLQKQQYQTRLWWICLVVTKLTQGKKKKEKKERKGGKEKEIKEEDQKKIINTLFWKMLLRSHGYRCRETPLEPTPRIARDALSFDRYGAFSGNFEIYPWAWLTYMPVFSKILSVGIFRILCMISGHVFRWNNETCSVGYGYVSNSWGGNRHLLSMGLPYIWRTLLTKFPWGWSCIISQSFSNRSNIHYN